MKATGIVVIGSLLFIASFCAKPAETNSTTAKSAPARVLRVRSDTNPERKASPPFTGKELPSPPRQHAAWTAPKSDLPTNYISATELLFQQGMADPRGCDYREIEVGTGSVWQGDGGVVKVHGWVLPGKAAVKFAVCWNGMVYPVVSISTNADLDADVARMATNGNYHGWMNAYAEPVAVSETLSIGLKGCFLLRLGRADLAEKLWLSQQLGAVSFQNEMRRRMSETNGLVSTNEIKLPGTDPYQDWATDWAWMMFDRMICAHERGDEKLALLTARQLAVAQPQIEATCASRGFKRQNYWDSQRQKELQPYLNFLGQLPDILTDLERRDKEGPHISILTTGVTNITDQSQRIAALIRDLDLVAARQWSQPGWVSPSQDAIVGALTAEGDAAVEPLLDCLEHDKRMTRSVGFGRDFARGRTVITVSQCADDALKSILQASFSSAAEMRAYWEQYKGLKIEDRWYAILQDDSARNRWQEAASKIAGSKSSTLRTRTNPTVTELLTRRAMERPAESGAQYDLTACCHFAEDLAEWDAAAAQDVARTLSRRTALALKYTDSDYGGDLTKLALILARNGDTHAFDDYAAWIVSTTPE